VGEQAWAAARAAWVRGAIRVRVRVRIRVRVR